ncbi:MAG: amino acid permease [Gemmataceae bacterium]|nr:amino acid permease [Gemmataceae bacterium]
MKEPAPPAPASDDERLLRALGYEQELHRGMSAFSNYAVSLSIICILAGCITSFHLGYCSTGGAAIGLGWPLGALFALVVASTMAQVASAFPTAGGLYHWAAILGGRGWGWAAAWFNLAGLITVLAAINVGTYQFVVNAFGPRLGLDPNALGPAGALVIQASAVLLITSSQALFNHLGIRVVTRLTDFSGYWILVVALLLTVCLLAAAPSWELGRLVTFANHSHLTNPEGKPLVWPPTDSLLWLFLLGLLLPAYTLTGYDASAHTAEETHGAARNVPRGIVRSVLVSGVFGWVMLCAVVLAAPNPDSAARSGEGAFAAIVDGVLPEALAVALYGGIAVAQYLCGLATVTSASRMAFAFARDGGLPFSRVLRQVSPIYRTPAFAVWAVALVAVGFTVYTPVYSTITVVCTVFLYISYVIPAALGLWAYGRTWTRMGPWDLGRWYRPLAVVSVLGCGVLFVIGVQPPNQQALIVVGGGIGVLAVAWFAGERRRFPGPPAAPLASGR